MFEEIVSLNIPFVLCDSGKAAVCPFLDEVIFLDNLETEIKADSEVIIDIESKELVNPAQININYVKKLSYLSGEFCKKALLRFEEGNIEEPLDIESYKNARIEKEDEIWLTLNIQFKIKKGCTEMILPKLFLVSAIISQGLTLCALAISIHVQGAPAPLTIALSVNSALFTLLTIVASGAGSSMARLGRYIDYTSCKRCAQDVVRLKDKLMFMGASSIFLTSWLASTATDAIGDFSEIQIIDKAGYAANLTFLTDEVINIHAWSLVVTVTIAGGAFGAHFAMTAASAISGLFEKNYTNANERNNTNSDGRHEDDPLLQITNGMRIN